MRLLPLVVTLAAISAAAAIPGAACAAHSPKTPPSCGDLSQERELLVRDSKLTTSSVEAKNTELGEAADALKVATTDARKEELKRRIAGLRRELSALEDKELSQVNRLGMLDSELSKRCKTGGGK